MNISRFFGATSREAMRQVRLALGPDALIVSNKRINGGVEILATDSTEHAVALETHSAPQAPQRVAPTPSAPSVPVMPPRTTSAAELMGAIESLKGSLEGRIEELMWSNQLRLNAEQLQLYQTLLEFGFSTALLRVMLKRMPAQLTERAALQWARNELDKHLPVLKKEELLWQPGVALAVVGPTGVGKTTTIAKLAARAVRRFGAENVVLITTDTYRIGAHEQLKIYADLLRIAIHRVQNAQELRQVMLGLRADQVILIDNVGVSQRDRYVQEQATLLASAGRRIQRLLALNAASHGDTLDEVARMYSKDGGTPLAGCIITKIDEAGRLGAALDVALRYQLPIHYVSDGQRVPENLGFYTAEQLVDMALSTNSAHRALFAPSTADLAAMMSSSHVQEQAQQHATTHKNMIKHVLALSGLSTDEADLVPLQKTVGLIDGSSFASSAFDLWRERKTPHVLADLSQRAVLQLRDAVLDITESDSVLPLVFHHVKQHLAREKAQLYLSVLGVNSGKLTAAPLVQLSDKQAWYSSGGISQRAKASAQRAELRHAMDWAQKNSLQKTVVHFVEEQTNQLWQQWQQEQRNVMALVAPSTRCWHVNGHSTPAAIAKQLEFYALNVPKMALPYLSINGYNVSELSFWYAQAPVVLRDRSGQAVTVSLFVLQLLDPKELKEIKTFYAFNLLDKQLGLDAEQLALYLLQHSESKNALRYVGRAYHHGPLQNLAKQHDQGKYELVEFAVAFGAAAWELEQYKALKVVNQLLLQLAGPTALKQTQITSSLLKLFSLKELLQ